MMPSVGFYLSDLAIERHGGSYEAQHMGVNIRVRDGHPVITQGLDVDGVTVLHRGHGGLFRDHHNHGWWIVPAKQSAQFSEEWRRENMSEEG